MKNFKMKDLWTIPNLMGYFRIILIPIFVTYYIKEKYMIASILVLISTFTDLFDGMIARKFNQVTDLGKILDPVADKLTHAALALCLVFRYKWMIALLVLMVLKEGYMAIMGIKFLKKDQMLNGAMWVGKVCTASLFIGLFVLFFFPHLSLKIVNGIIFVLMAIMLYTWISYIQVYRKMGKEDKND